jgi:hypothetical protein
MKLYMFLTVPLSIIRSLFGVHSAMVYVIQVCRQLLSRSICSCSKAALNLEDLCNDYNPNLGNVGVHDVPYDDMDLQ